MAFIKAAGQLKIVLAYQRAKSSMSFCTKLMQAVSSTERLILLAVIRTLRVRNKNLIFLFLNQNIC